MRSRIRHPYDASGVRTWCTGLITGSAGRMYRLIIACLTGLSRGMPLQRDHRPIGIVRIVELQPSPSVRKPILGGASDTGVPPPERLTWTLSQIVRFRSWAS